MSGLNRAIEIAGTQVELARKAGVTQAAISRWINGVTQISPASAIKIEEATDGLVTRQELLPNVFNIPPSVTEIS